MSAAELSYPGSRSLKQRYTYSPNSRAGFAERIPGSVSSGVDALLGHWLGSSALVVWTSNVRRLPDALAARVDAGELRLAVGADGEGGASRGARPRDRLALDGADKASARAVRDKVGVKTVTLEGDLYDPSGTLTGGSRARSTNSLLARLSLLARASARA